MNWYFASRKRHQEAISKISDFLKSNNQQIVYDWSKVDSLKPYNANSDKSSLVADKIGSSLKNTDIFVLISDEGGTDMFIELGIAIGRWMSNPKIKIYCVGKYNSRSLMHFHPAIIRVDKLVNVFSAECPEILTPEFISFINSLEF